MSKVEKRHSNIDYANRKVVVLPIAAMDDEFLESLKTTGRWPGADINNTFTYRLPGDSDQDNSTIRTYIGHVFAEGLRDFCLANSITYADGVEVRLLVVMMEAVVAHRESSMADECVKYARHLPEPLMNMSFDIINSFFNSHESRDVIHYIQDNL